MGGKVQGVAIHTGPHSHSYSFPPKKIHSNCSIVFFLPTPPLRKCCLRNWVTSKEKKRDMRRKKKGGKKVKKMEERAKTEYANAHFPYSRSTHLPLKEQFAVGSCNVRSAQPFSSFSVEECGRKQRGSGKKHDFSGVPGLGDELGWRGGAIIRHATCDRWYKAHTHTHTKI